MFYDYFMIFMDRILCDRNLFIFFFFFLVSFDCFFSDIKVCVFRILFFFSLAHDNYELVVVCWRHTFRKCEIDYDFIVFVLLYNGLDMGTILLKIYITVFIIYCLSIYHFFCWSEREPKREMNLHMIFTLNEINQNFEIKLNKLKKEKKKNRNGTYLRT